MTKLRQNHKLLPIKIVIEKTELNKMLNIVAPTQQITFNNYIEYIKLTMIKYY